MKLDEKTDRTESKNEAGGTNKLFNLHDRVREFETKLIKNALAEAAGNQRKAAQILGIKRTTLHNKIKNYGIKLKITSANFDN